MFFGHNLPMNTNHSNTQKELWGQDIALGELGQVLVAANGEIILTNGVETGLQDIRLRLFTRLGELFYDTNFGSLIHDWVLEDSTEETRAAFCAEVIMRVELDPRVVVGSVSCTVTEWDERSLTATLRFQFIGENSPLNLVLQANTLTREFILRDVSPRANSLNDYL